MELVKLIVLSFAILQISSAKKYVIIDTDGGPDDVLALILAFHSHQKGLIDILALTGVYGNTNVDNVVKNILLTQRVSKAENIPVYKGSKTPLMSLKGYDETYFGEDGLGNSTYLMDPIDVNISNESAVTAMVRIVNQYPKEVTIIALGPLTNIALAAKIDPLFLDNLDGLSVMGGTLDANQGNIGPNTEFNFINDPEAVQIVLENGRPTFSLATWDTAKAHTIPFNEWNKLIGLGTKRSDFVKIINKSLQTQDPKNSTSNDMVLCDILAVLLHVYPQYITQTHVYPVTMELTGTSTRGQLVVGQTPPYDKWVSARDIRFVERFDLNKTEVLLNEMLSEEN